MTTLKYRNLRTGGVGEMTEKQAAASPAELELVKDDAKPALPMMWKPKTGKKTAEIVENEID